MKVWPVIEEAIIASEKVALTLLIVGETPVAPGPGTVLMTVGAVVSPPCVVETVKERVAGEVSVLPAASIACTLNV
jgi:hypothetical protein